jgi:hypothetical protein
MISFQTVLSYGSYLVIILLLVDKFWNGAGKIRQEVIDTYKERNKQLEDILIDHQKQINVQGQDIARLSGIVGEKDKMIKTLNDTILNRNPALEKTLRDNVETNKAIRQLLEDLKGQSTILARKTDEQTVMIKSQVKHEDRIDEDTELERGNVLRKK